MEFLLNIMRWFIRLFFRVKIQGLEKLDFSRPVILMPNHTSLLDAVFLALFLPSNVTFVVNTGIAQRFSWMMKFRKHIMINPHNPYSIRQMVRIVNQQQPLVIFPEGRITTTGGLMKIYNGIGYLALRTGASIYPVILNGLERSKLSYLGDKQRTHLFPRVKITIETAFSLNREEGKSMRVQKKQATEHIYRILQNAWLNSRLKEQVNLYNELLHSARLNGADQTIVEDPTQSLSYRKLILASHALSQKLIQYKKENRMGVLLPSSNGHLIALFSFFRIGITPAILNFSQGIQTVRECCETAEIQTILTSKQFIEKAGLQELLSQLERSYRIVYLEDLKDLVTYYHKVRALIDYLVGHKSQADTNELVLFTSGSEAKPKGVVLTHRNIYANIQQVLCAIDVTAKDKIFNALPMFHSFGLTAGTILPILTGVQTYLYPSPLHYKAIPELCYDKNATLLFGTSTFLAGYGRFAHPYDFYSIRYVVAGAEPLKDEVRQLWMEKFGIRILEGYGATETSPVLSINTPLAYQKNTVGRLLPGMEKRIDPIAGIERGGRLLVKGPNVMKGYLLHGEGFRPADEWYDTGDIVDENEDGFLTIQARLKRFAKVGGEMISLQLVETLAAQCYDHPEVSAVTVPDSRRGERIYLFTTKQEDRLEVLRNWLQQHHYSAMLIPAKVIAVHQLPLLGSGKTDYVTLKQWAINQDRRIL
ncbi:AMP-binding protein [Ammoniphilus resinae]|uniref:Acyl-[acyl-carrier-protein]-phospholipid O-acyltransferase/long-chain-fatty-acid--[acyl-carrier-protein] ligase n=1 Tax=Ammoniphilus resinae TaxID=861532 RepID=A0ABS4GU97_9BACL|nr:AMP-binding protein [Ammoniphilus resinae]MBP1933831.1 acyl-[acyl-carrier-protein]-phospholipid O-acyltransferase/long-chain-fatty-acid--[acyl-carrier-protein] ligase [Ammoniphilus resinae]